MDPNHKLWNSIHQQLTRALRAGDRTTAITLFLHEHAMLHTAGMSKSGVWSFVDQALAGLTDDQIRRVPPGDEHSIAWILLHLARIEDITMNLLVAGKAQVFTPDGWGKKMNIPILHSANRMGAASLRALSREINVKALKAYRTAVGRRTQGVVKKLWAEDFKRPVDPTRLKRVLEEGAVSPEAMEIVNYWSRKTITGLLLMPPTRHCILHLNEAMRIRKKLLK